MTKESYQAIYAKYRDWFELSKEERKEKKLPLNQREFSIYHGVNQMTLSMWNKKIDEGNEYNGEFDPKNYIDENLEKLLKKLISVASGEKGTAKHLELALKIAGLLVEKREDTVKLEYTPADHTRIARETIDGLRAEHKELGGICPVCGECKALCDETLLDTESGDAEDREVATLALSARPV